MKIKYNQINEIKAHFKGEFHTSLKWRLLYATDASSYREIPTAVAIPKDKEDIKYLIKFSNENGLSLIPRGAGTSLAGQVVGKGIVVDVSKYMNKIQEINCKDMCVTVEPGIVLDELNTLLEPYKLFFAPETSSSNRCTIGGMVSNNSCGAHSLLYGSTREHLNSIEALLSDGSEVKFMPLTIKEFNDKCYNNNLEGDIYKQIKKIFSDQSLIDEIKKEYPLPSIKRRNTGYALDLLYDNKIFCAESNKPFNFCQLLAGSEGTLTFMHSITLNLLPLKQKYKGLLCIHFKNIEDAVEANLIILKYDIAAIEMIDNTIINCALNHQGYRQNNFFITGNPSAILIIEFIKDKISDIVKIAKDLEAELKNKNLGYHYQLIMGDDDMKKIWAIRKAGLGLISTIRGDAKPVSVIEDTAVAPQDLPSYIYDLKQLLNKYHLQCVYYGHIATGQLHLKPILNLKKSKDVELFKIIAIETAKLVKKYKGSISGEHGDGRLRAEFIPLMYGNNIYNTFCEIKKKWDPNNIFNPGKIINSQAIISNLRYKIDNKEKNIKTFFDFSDTDNIIKAVEQCNGSADCRKKYIFKGTMCPSYMATLDETSTTRARANILREFLSNSSQKNPFNYSEIYEIMDLCLSCKGCKSECPSNIDMAKYKAEFLYNWYKSNIIPISTKLISSITLIYKFGSMIPKFFNYIITNKYTSLLIKKILNFHPKRDLPLLYKTTFTKWYKKYYINTNHTKNKKTVYFFIDEFSQYNDVEIAIKAVKLLDALGYKVLIPSNYESGRIFISKGLLKKARKIAEKNIELLKDFINEETPLLGLEPSAILSFKDEYVNLVRGKFKIIAKKIAQNTFMIDEFIANEYEKGYIKRNLFTSNKAYIRLHGHCHQKALISTKPTIKMLEIPINYKVNEIKSGCCGMAGVFGYEKKHYELSMKIGELILFPEINKESKETIIAAPGTSCRQQILAGTGRKAYHPIEILYDALIKN